MYLNSLENSIGRILSNFNMDPNSYLKDHLIGIFGDGNIKIFKIELNILFI